MKKIWFFICTIQALACGYASASCTKMDYIKSTVPDFKIVVQRDVPIGTKIGSVTFTPASTEVIKCNTGTTYYEMKYQGATPTSISNVYETNIEGVGVSISQPSFNRFWTNPATTTSRSVINIVFSVNTEVAFYKTGNITSGNIGAGLAVQSYGDDRVPAFEIYFATGSITQVACSIKTPSLVFPIGDVPTSAFGSSVGTIPTNANKTQNLGLDCDPEANVNVTLTGTQNPDVSTQSVLALTGQGDEGVAKGVGVQLLYGGTPLELDKRIVLKKSSGGLESFPIMARYYQTKTSVTPGSANTSATLTLTYQ